MKTALFAALVLCPVFAQASFVKIVSPTTAQTYSYSDVTWHTLHWDAGSQRLTANLTFSTYKYVTHYDPLHEESYQFVLPGVKFDRDTNTFFVRTAQGKLPVAELSKDLIGQSIKPLPGTVLHIFKESGKVTVTLTATNAPQRFANHMHWLEENDGFFLDNAVSTGLEAMRR